MPRPGRQPPRRPSSHRDVESRLRIIGGELRGRTVVYNGDPGLRPMKDRVRESLFNLLGPQVKDKLVLDLFAGTGAVSFEAISRGALRAILIERRFPNVRVINETAATLGIADRIQAVGADAFCWVKSQSPDSTVPWLVVICPPYELFVARRQDLLDMIDTLWRHCPAASAFVVECDQRFDLSLLPDAATWNVRSYPPAVIAIAKR